MRRRNGRIIFAVMLAALVGGGCQTTKSPPTADFSGDFGQPANVTAGPPAEVTPGQRTSPDAILPTDPAAVRLQDMGGYFLLYYHAHQQMPPSLDDLRAMPGGEDLNVTSPSSGQPFAYYPDGIWASEKGDKCIIANDPVLGRNGKRWCLFMAMPKAGEALSVEVVAVLESTFRNYRAGK